MVAQDKTLWVAEKRWSPKRLTRWNTRTGKVIYENMDKILHIDGVTPHIYGKKETRPFRKMGHVTRLTPRARANA